MHRAGRAPHTTSRAFTIVEVLVVAIVLGIIAMITVPSLTHARNVSRRTDCSSHLRQTGYALSSYAVISNDLVPLGYVGNQKQFNYLLNFNGHVPGEGHVSYPTLFGALYVNQLVIEPRVLYCPTNTMPAHTFKGSNERLNPWPPTNLDLVREAHTTVGYGTRPVVSWPLLSKSSSTPPIPAGLPALKNLKDTAILSDILSTPEHIDRAHGNGINLLYGDLSTDFINRSKFDRLHNQIPNNDFAEDTDTKNKILLDATTIPHQGLWPSLDR